MKELHSESEDQDLEFTQECDRFTYTGHRGSSGGHRKDQAALEKRADQETAVLPRLTLPGYGRTGCIRKEFRFRQNTLG